MNKEQLRVLANLAGTADGIEFLKLLEDLSKKNYEAWKRSSPDMNEVCKGKALAIDELISSFNSATSKLNKFEEVPKDWM